MFRYALVVVPGLERNPASYLDVVAVPLLPVNHNPFLRIAELPKLLQRVRNYCGRLQTQLGLRFLFLTGVRTGELRLAIPDQFHLGQGLWVIPPDVVKQLEVKMHKKRRKPQDIPPYILPLSEQATEIFRYQLNHLKPAQRHSFRHDFDLNKCMSENTLNKALNSMGYRDLLTWHGIRSTISTALNEIGYPKTWVDAQLSHLDPNKASATYNHAEYVEQRRRMMQDWADRLDLFEQNQIEAASMPLIVHVGGIAVVQSEQAMTVSADKSVASPIQLVAQSGSTVPLISAPMQRLPAVPLLRSAMQPVSSDIQRERMELFDLFDASHNLPVVAFAKMAGKSRRWINYEIKAGNSLALNVGNRGQRVPGWHLDPIKHSLVQAVLKLNRDADPWRIYVALLQPQTMLRRRSVIEAVTIDNLDQVIMAISSTVKEREWMPLCVA